LNLSLNDKCLIFGKIYLSEFKLIDIT